MEARACIDGGRRKTHVNKVCLERGLKKDTKKGKREKDREIR